MCKDYLLCFLSNRYHHKENMQDMFLIKYKQELNILMSKLWIMENLVLNQQRWNWYTYQIYNSLSE